MSLFLIGTMFGVCMSGLALNLLNLSECYAE